jgi:hypothetical protein
VVKKRGFKTRATHGIVIDPSVTRQWKPDGAPLDMNAWLLNQAVVLGTDTSKNLIFAEKGDSGSVVLEGTKATGLLWAHDYLGGRYGIMSPIDEVLAPDRLPWSRSACRTQFDRVCAVQPILAAIEAIAAHCDVCSARCSCTIRTARSRTSTEKFRDVL